MKQELEFEIVLQYLRLFFFFFMSEAQGTVDELFLAFLKYLNKDNAIAKQASLLE